MEKAFLIFLLIQTSCVFAPKQNSKSQFAEDSITRTEEEQRKNENSVSYRQDELIEYGYVIPDTVTAEGSSYHSYRVVSREAGAYYCVSIYNREYRIPDIMDYGDLNLKVYKNEDSILLLIGLDDLYGSVYFVYLFEDNVLKRLGGIDIEQSGDVEKNGVKSIFFKVYRRSNLFIVEDYLDNIHGKTIEFAVEN